MSTHHGEIQFMKALVVKCAMTGTKTQIQFMTVFIVAYARQTCLYRKAYQCMHECYVPIYDFSFMLDHDPSCFNIQHITMSFPEAFLGYRFR